MRKTLRSMANWKKVTLLIVGIIFLTRAGFIAVRGEIDKEYFTSGEFDFTEATTIPCQNVSQTFVSTQDRLNSLEFYFVNIADDKAGALTTAIYSGEELIYQTNITLSNVNNSEWKKIFVNAELKKNTEYKIILNASEECTQIPNVPVVNTGTAPEVVLSYAGDGILNGNIAVKYGYLRSPGMEDRMVMISLWIILYFLICLGILRSEQIWKQYVKFRNHVTAHADGNIVSYMMELLGCMLIINCSGIPFQELTKIILYAISLLAVFNMHEKKKYIDRIADCNRKKAVLIILYFYASFALVGQRIFIYPLTLKLTTEGLFVYLVTTAWFVPVINSILFYLNAISENSFSQQKRLTNGRLIVLCSALLVIPGLYNLFANNPGMSSPDTYYCMITSAHNLHGTENWHPAFYCMILRLIQIIWDSTYTVIIAQYFFWTYVMCEFFLFLKKKNLSDSIIIMAAAFCGINAGNFLFLNTIWKDIPYTLSLLWTFIIIARMSIDFDECKSKWYIYLELVFSLVGVYFYRRNGVVSFIIVAASLAIVLRKNKKLIASLFVSVILIGIISGPVYTYFEIQDTGRNGIYHGLGQDILGVYYSGGEVSEQTLKMINMMTAYNNAEYVYTPTWSNQSYVVDVPPTEFVVNYLDTFLKNPLIMTRAIIDREDALWDIYPGMDSALAYVNYTDTEDWAEGWNDYYSKRIYRSLYTGMSAATAYTANAQWLSAIEWRCGLLLLLAGISYVLLIIRFGFRKYLLMLAPSIGHIMSLLLSTGWSDFRYFWVMNPLDLCAILLTIVIIQEYGFIKQNRIE